MTALTVAQVLARHGGAVTERELADALDDLFASKVLDPPVPAEQAPLSQGARDVLADHGGIAAAPAGRVAHQRAMTVARTGLQTALALTTAQVAQRLGIDVTRVRHRLRDRALYALPTTGRGRRFPSWQFVDGQVLPHLAAVLRSLPADLHPLEVEGFFTRPMDDLELEGAAVSPSRWLLAGGDPAPVARAARALSDLA